MRRNKLPDTCFSVLPSTGQLIIIKNGENGYYPSEWDTGSREKNREIASDHNEQRGISDIQESAMLAGSMFGWNTPGANPQWYLDNAKYVNADILQGHVKDPVTGAYSTSVKIGESGSATLEGLEPGVYVVSEESVPEPYILSHTEQTVALRPGKTTEVHFQNYKKPGLEILKKNIANMDPIPDMTYKVEQIDGSFETTVTTDLRGRAFLEDLPVGSYRISEVGGPSHVILSEIPQVIYLEAGCTRTVTFFNAIKPTLTVLKQNSVTSDPLPGAKLHIYYASDNTSTGEMHDLGVFYSNEEGKVVLVDAERGWYKIVEESCPQGFGYLDGEAVQEFYLEENTSKTVIIRNVPLSALVGFKYDSKTGKGIPGCRFELR